MVLDEKIIQKAIQDILDKIDRDEFKCIEQKSSGDSVIGKPVVFTSYIRNLKKSLFA